jgi:hypothetical protein
MLKMGEKFHIGDVVKYPFPCLVFGKKNFILFMHFCGSLLECHTYLVGDDKGVFF